MKRALARLILLALSVLPVLSVLSAPVAAQSLAPGYQDLCRAEKIPKWAYGKPDTPMRLQPLFGCDRRFGGRRDADERHVEKMQSQGMDDDAVFGELLRQGWDGLRQRKLPLALNRFNLAFEVDPGNGDAYHGIAVIMVESEQSAKVAEYWFQRAVKAERGQATRFADYGAFLMRQDRVDEALPLLQRALALEPENVWTAITLAALHFDRGARDAACALMRRLADAKPPPGIAAEEFSSLLDGWRERAEREGC